MKFGLGSMSTEIIEAVYQYSNKHSVELMLIASKNQIDYGGGYVNDWDTREYTNHLQILQTAYEKSQVLICRDHCGTGFTDKKTHYSIEDPKQTIKTDIEYGFDLLHIDLCRYHNHDIIASTHELIEYARNLNPSIQIEIGTDAIEEPLDVNKCEITLRQLLPHKPTYYVVNTGSLVKENKQVGKFKYRHDIARLHDICSLYGVQIKEHNADYLSSEEIKIRSGYVDAMNIAPQLGVVQTSTVLHECQKFGINVDKFIYLVYNSGRWEKWEDGNLTENPYLSTIVAGHYHYTSDEYCDIVHELNKHINIKDRIQDNIKDVIGHYLNHTRIRP